MASRIPVVSLFILLASLTLTIRIDLHPGLLEAFAFHVRPFSASCFLERGALTALFAHPELERFWPNLYGWLLVGFLVEREIGSRPFAILIAFSQVCCLLVSWLLMFRQDAFLLGSSGALLGVMTFFLIFAIKRGFEAAAATYVFGLVALSMSSEAFLTLINSFEDSDVPISNAGHFGGILGGVLFWQLYYSSRFPDRFSMEAIMTSAFQKMRRK